MFNSELELQNKFVEFMQINKQNNEEILSEFNARFGDVDVVKTVFDKSLIFNEKETLALMEYRNSKILGLLHKKSLRKMDYLILKSGYDKTQVRSSLNRLISAGIVQEIRKNSFVIDEQFSYPNLQFYSYEAKLTDWKKAISQAVINKKFSTYSYTVFPKDFALKLLSKHKNIFLEYNVGLIGVDKSSVNEYIIPKKTTVSTKKNPTFISSIAKFNEKILAF